ncbi:MAG: ABC transporter permease [Clostridiales bacterium]|nr:ABC transporter permease [Clostridiales bacterium]
MSFRSRFIIALQKIMKSKARAVKSILCLSLTAFIIIFVGGITVVLKEVLEKLVYEQASECYVASSFYPNQEIMKEVSEYKDIEQSIWMTVPFSDVSLKVDGTEYKGTAANDWKLRPGDGYLDEKYFHVDRYDTHGCWFASVDLKELKVRFGKDTCIVYGSDKLEKGGIMVSDFVLKHFGFEEDDLGNLIGKELEFTTVAGEDHEVVVGPYRLTGIIDSDYFRLSANKYGLAHIMIDSRDGDNSEYEGGEIRFYSDNFENCSNLMDKFRTLGLADLYNETLEAYNMLNLLKHVLLKVFVVILSVFALALISGYLMTVYFEYCEEKNFEQIQKVIGMKEADLFMISVIRDLIYVLGSVIPGGIIAFVAFAITDYVAYWNIDVHLMPSWQLFLTCVLISLSGLLFFSLIKTIVYRRALSREHLAESLSTGDM